MRCPNCHRDMIVVEYKQIELDHCLNCRGVWFDAGELELLLKSAGMPSVVPATQNIQNSEKRRRCPICDRRMNKVSLCDQPVVPVDACSVGHGLFFDGGELEQVLKELAAKAPACDQPSLTFLSEVFQAPKT